MKLRSTECGGDHQLDWISNIFFARNSPVNLNGAGQKINTREPNEWSWTHEVKKKNNIFICGHTTEADSGQSVSQSSQANNKLKTL